MAAIGITSSSSAAVSKVWRKIQGDLSDGFNFMVEESEWLDDYPDTEFPWSQREVTFTVDVADEVGVAAIPDGGYRARPSAADIEEATFALTNFNATFTASHLAKWADQGNTNQIEKELRKRGAKKVQAMARAIGDSIYGTSVGTLALTDSDLAGGTDTLTLYYGFGSSTITNAAYIADRFRVGEYISYADGTPAQTDTAYMGAITAVSASTPSIDVTWVTTPTISTNALKVVSANSLENATIAGTNYNKMPVGFLDVLNTASVHGISSSSVPRWDVGFEDTTTGGRLDPTKIQKLDDSVTNAAPGMKGPDTYLMSQGVYRDLVDQQRAAQEFTSPIGMELDGSVKKKGKTFRKTRRVPPGYFIGYDKSKYQKLMLVPRATNNLRWDDGIDLINQEGSLFVMNTVFGLACRSRASFGYYSGLTES